MRCTFPGLQSGSGPYFSILVSSMSIAQRELIKQVPDEFAEVERQIRLWGTEALQLAHTLESLATALRANPSQITFRGDLIVLDSRRRSSDLALAIVDLAKIRNLVCNVKILQSQRKQLKAQRKVCRVA
jgi:hypothetical protein